MVKVNNIKNGLQVKLIKENHIELFKMVKDDNSGDITITVGIQSIIIPKSIEQNRISYLIRKNIFNN